MLISTIISSGGLYSSKEEAYYSSIHWKLKLNQQKKFDPVITPLLVDDVLSTQEEEREKKEQSYYDEEVSSKNSSSEGKYYLVFFIPSITTYRSSKIIFNFRFNLFVFCWISWFLWRRSNDDLVYHLL